MANLNEDFAARVLAVLGAMSLRGAMLKTGIDHATIGKMRMGFVPRSETVIRFAQGFGLDVNEWLALAGYEPLPEPEVTGSQILDLGLRALGKEFGRPVRASFDEETKQQMSPEDAFRQLAWIRGELEANRL